MLKMKKLSIITFVWFAGIFISAQTDITDRYERNASVERPVVRKGSMFVFWGWNRAAFSKSDIHFKGADYDFQLENVVAHDRQTDFSFYDYFHPLRVTIPQTNVRIGYFVTDDIAVVAGLDHMKYVMDQDQTVNFKGHIGNPTYAAKVINGKINLSDAEFLQFEHTDGLNYIHVGAEKYKHLYDAKNIDIEYALGGGVGVLFPKSNVTLMQFPRSDRFHLAGMGADVRANINFIFWKHLLARVEAKYGYINMWDIKTTLNDQPDKAMQDFVFAQLNFGIGYVFNTKK